MKSISAIWQLLVASFQWFHASTIAPETENVPPIRYDGDAQDIFLA